MVVDRPTKDYMVTLRNQDKVSKWIVTAVDKSTALNYALLIHDDNHKWEVSMATISYRGTNPVVNEAEYTVADPSYVDRLNRIREHSFDRLENC